MQLLSREVEDCKSRFTNDPSLNDLMNPSSKNNNNYNNSAKPQINTMMTATVSSQSQAMQQRGVGLGMNAANLQQRRGLQLKQGHNSNNYENGAANANITLLMDKQ